MLNEKQHAFIVEGFYRRIKAHDPRLCKEVFLFCTRKYAEERGSRMAQRALRDGFSLDLGTYRSYGEWDYTSPEVVENKVLETSPNYRYIVTKCPWNTQFSEMNAMECAEEYCMDLDRSLSRGFNPDLNFEVGCTMHSCGHCDFILHGAGRADLPPVNEANKRPFAFHCGHVLAVFARCVRNIYGDEGEKMTLEVEHDFGEKYGKEALGELLEYKKLDFLSIDV
ncbi:MAG: L-2-amino-thiazoline-4-carboxylic acid hydrolase [Clostridia bacterium]|nr:L-2-amino-thiazoline-4-carboxylic acid hydrolase [Clostridia bacterium]